MIITPIQWAGYSFVPEARACVIVEMRNVEYSTSTFRYRASYLNIPHGVSQLGVHTER